MKQFYIFALTGATIAILNLIDTAFGNNISVDSICVLSAFTIVYWCVCIFYRIGVYAFRVKLKHVTECFILQVSAAIVCSLILIIFCNKIPYMYHLTGSQYALFTKCLFWRGIFLIFGAIVNFYETYVKLTCQNRHVIAGNVIFYVLMISADAIVILNHGECYHLIIATGISEIGASLYYLLCCRIKFEKPSMKIVKECFFYAKDILTDRALGKVATVFFNACASRLGTDLYALHSVGYGIATSLEEITNSCYMYQVVNLKVIDNLKDRYNAMKTYAKRMFLPAVIISYATATLMVIPTRGDLSLSSAFVITMLYNSQAILVQIYESCQGYLTSCEATKCLRLGGLFGILVRIPIALVSTLTPVGIYGFAFGSGIDFLARGLYYRYESRKLVNRSISA